MNLQDPLHPFFQPSLQYTNLLSMLDRVNQIQDGDNESTLSTTTSETFDSLESSHDGLQISPLKPIDPVEHPSSSLNEESNSTNSNNSSFSGTELSLIEEHNDLEWLTEQLSPLRKDPYQLFKKVMTYWDQEDLRVKSLLLLALKDAVDLPDTHWKKRTSKKVESLRAHRKAACYVAEAYQSGIGLVQDDQMAWSYYDKAMAKLNPDKETNYIGKVYLKAARFKRDQAEKEKNNRDRLEGLEESVKLFKKSVKAEFSTDNNRVSAWSEIADIYFQLINDGKRRSQQNIKKLKLNAYKACCKALGITPETSARAMQSIINNLSDRSRIKALAILGYLFFLGYYKYETDDVVTFDTKMSLDCFKKVMGEGSKKAALWAIKACILLSTDEKKNEAQEILNWLQQRIEGSTDEKKQKVQAIYKKAEELYKEKWCSKSYGIPILPAGPIPPQPIRRTVIKRGTRTSSSSSSSQPPSSAKKRQRA